MEAAEGGAQFIPENENNFDNLEDFSNKNMLHRLNGRARHDECNLITIQIWSIGEIFISRKGHIRQRIRCCVLREMIFAASVSRSSGACYKPSGSKRNKLDFWLKTYFICRSLIVNSNSITPDAEKVNIDWCECEETTDSGDFPKIAFVWFIKLIKFQLRYFNMEICSWRNPKQQ